MAVYLDTSAFLKLVMAEAHSETLRRWVGSRTPQAFSCDLLRAEALRVARRHSPAALSEVRQRLDALVLLTLTPALCERAGDLDPAILGTLDALHLAAALSVGEELEGIVTYDDRLAEGARLHGVEVFHPT